MRMASIVWLDGVLASVLSPFAAVLKVVVGRVMVRGVATGKRVLQGHVPSVASVPVTALLIAVIGIGLACGVALPALTAAVNFVHARVNEETTEGIVAPESSAVSGSSTSFVAWDSRPSTGVDVVRYGRQLWVWPEE
jgi:uncharacterized membrane protein